MAWPGDAAVVVSLVGLVKIKQGFNNPSVFQGKTVEAINSRLRPKPERPDPSKLNTNEGYAFVGSMVYGDGFEITSLERDQLIESNPDCHKLIFPYLGGEEVNTSASQSFRRYVINFGEMSLEEARVWTGLMQIVEERVKPYREILKKIHLRLPALSVIGGVMEIPSFGCSLCRNRTIRPLPGDRASHEALNAFISANKSHF